MSSDALPAGHLLRLLVVVLFLLAGCAGVTQSPERPPGQGIDGVACAGDIENPPEGFTEVEDATLLQTALGASAEGRLCQGRVFESEQSITVYRVWNSAKSYSLLGQWWSFEKPEGPRQAYREANVICPSWSRLDRMSTCTLKVGTRIVIGPGQSAACRQTTYGKSAVNQVFIPNDALDQVILVENCSPGVVWP